MFRVNVDLLSANTFNFDKAKILSSDKELTLSQTTKILGWSKLEALADNKIKVLKMMTFVYDRAENIVGKGENAGYQHFIHFPQCFQKAFYSRSLKIEIVWSRVMGYQAVYICINMEEPLT